MCRISCLGVILFTCSQLKADDFVQFCSSVYEMATEQNAMSNAAQRCGFDDDAFVSCLPGFTCVFKQRYEDFIVHEIAPDGTVVHLTNLKAPTTIAPVPGPSSQVESDSKDYSSLHSLLTPEQLTDFESLLTRDKDAVDVDVKDLDKSHRKCIHQAIRERYAGQLMSTMMSEENVIRVQRQQTANSRKRQMWPHGGDYCRFVLFKQNRDTHQALSQIAAAIRLHRSTIGIAGTKDKRSVSTQRATCYRTEATKVAGLNKTLQNVRVGNFEYTNEAVALGSLWGNQFTIVLRNVEAPRDQLASWVDTLRNAGFLNFYGDQRFGTGHIPTSDVGLALLRSDWQRAVELILNADTECDDEKACRQIWSSTRDVGRALQAVKHQRSIEGTLLRALKKYGATNYRNAVMDLPRNTRNLYVHAYQSHVWNRLVCRRWRTHGLKVITGDLVWNNQSCETSVKTITEVELESTKLSDVVMPLPGSDVKMPDNCVAHWLKEMLEDDGLTLSVFEQMKKQFSVSGDYRHILIVPTNVQHTYTRYDDATVSLVYNDLDLINQGKSIASVDESIESVLCSPPPSDIESMRYGGLIIRFRLSAGSYATMALRELIRMNMSKAHQTSLNDYCNNKDNDNDTTNVADVDTTLVDDKKDDNTTEVVVVND